MSCRPLLHPNILESRRGIQVAQVVLTVSHSGASKEWTSLDTRVRTAITLLTRALAQARPVIAIFEASHVPGPSSPALMSPLPWLLLRKDQPQHVPNSQYEDCDQVLHEPSHPHHWWEVLEPAAIRGGVCEIKHLAGLAGSSALLGCPIGGLGA